MSGEELKLVESVLFDEDLYDDPDHATLLNLEARKPAAEAIYLSEIGRLGRLQFGATARPNSVERFCMAYRDFRTDSLMIRP